MAACGAVFVLHAPNQSPWPLTAAVHRSNNFETVFDWCNKQHPPSQPGLILRLLFDGDALQPSHTPEMHDMEEGDYIDVAYRPAAVVVATVAETAAAAAVVPVAPACAFQVSLNSPFLPALFFA